ncbi:hypothetical protein [Ignatzschineria indica]|uniref:hypothetical protein n=1 Tax=Ignatzschineria indica TaxID=472583 RepID=UPI003636D665
MVVNALMQSMKLAIDEIPLALDMALKAGQGVSFELGDMSKWLPQQLASASSRGMRGMDHYREILVMNEQAAVVAGTNDQQVTMWILSYSHCLIQVPTMPLLIAIIKREIKKGLISLKA